MLQVLLCRAPLLRYRVISSLDCFIRQKGEDKLISIVFLSKLLHKLLQRRFFACL